MATANVAGVLMFVWFSKYRSIFDVLGRTQHRLFEPENNPLHVTQKPNTPSCVRLGAAETHNKETTRTKLCCRSKQQISCSRTTAFLDVHVHLCLLLLQARIFYCGIFRWAKHEVTWDHLCWMRLDPRPSIPTLIPSLATEPPMA